MTEKISSLSEMPLRKPSNTDILPVHPQVQTRYLENLSASTKIWNERFSAESTHSMPDGKSYGKYENGKLVPDLNADFWIHRSNDIIAQMELSMKNSGVSSEKLNELISIINNNIRADISLTFFGKYLRIEALALAYATQYSKKK
ncbi:hypothetical protein HOO68_02690 [Candidatus Gracilibacteria bacterium]|nr:hypothetical protein [Candidatus Gracilibacteria bacterium]